MAQKITFTFPTSTITGTNYRVFKLYSNSSIILNLEPVFVNLSMTGNDPYSFTPPDNTSYINNIIIKGASINNFASNFKLWLDAQLTFNGGVYFETSIVGNVVELIWGSNSDTNTFEFTKLDASAHDSAWLTYTTEAYTITTPIVPVVLDEQIILSRSPYHFQVSPGILFDDITAEVFIYRGHKVDDKPLISTYNLSKSVVQVGQSTINFDIHKLVNDYVKNNYTSVGTSGAFTSSLLDSVWVYVDAKINLAGVEQYQTNQLLLAIDGFGYYTELANPQINYFQKFLSNVTNHIIYNDSDYPLYFITEDLLSITVNGTSIPFTFSQDYSNQKIGYVNVANYIGSSTSFTAVLTYYCGEDCEPVEDTHYFTIKDECKFPLINCIFKNKFGVWQTIPFNKLSKKSQDFTNESYNGLISNYGNYALNKHVKQTFNINGKEKITVNTDFIPEEYNTLFTELMLSEFIYLEDNGQILPVNLMKNSFEKKTKLNNKLIQYSMDFEYSFNLLNNII